MGGLNLYKELKKYKISDEPTELKWFNFDEALKVNLHLATIVMIKKAQQYLNRNEVL